MTIVQFDYAAIAVNHGKESMIRCLLLDRIEENLIFRPKSHPLIKNNQHISFYPDEADRVSISFCSQLALMATA